MGFWIIAAELGAEVGLWTVNKYLLDTGSKLPKPRPEGLEFAQATIGSPIPYFAGTVRIDNPILVWHGNHGVIPQGTSFLYEVNMLLELGTPMWDEATAPWNSWRAVQSAVSSPRVIRFWYGDKEWRFDGMGLLHGIQRFASIDLEGEGEFFAGLEFFDGRPDQTLAGSYTVFALTQAGTPAHLIPGYRNKALLGVHAGPPGGRGQIGKSPRVAAMSVEVREVGPQPPGPVGEFGEPFGIDANPAWVLYDLLCRPVFGLGYEPAQVDLDSFQAAADTLFDEGHGCSIVIQRIEDAPKIFRTIESQIDGVVFENPATGKIMLRLIRQDYDIDDLQEINTDNTLGVPQVDTIGWHETINEISVSFTNRSRGYKPDTVASPRLANSAARGYRVRTLDFEAPGCMTAELASKIGARELSVHGRPFRAVKAKVNREFFAAMPADVLRANWPAIDIVDVPFRVLEVDLGQLADDPITLSLVEDIFDQTTGSVEIPPDDTTPVTLPPLTERVLDEAPYLLQYLALVRGQLSNLTDQRILAAAVAEGLANRLRENTQSGGTTGFLDGNPTLDDQGPGVFPTTATVAVAYPATAAPYDTVTGLVVENVGGEFAATFASLSANFTQISYGAANLALVGDELLAFESVTDLGGGQYRLNRVWREVIDTVPVDHAVGERVYLIDHRAIGRRAWPIDFYARGFAIPSYGATLGSDGENASDDILITGRAARPLRAADVRIRGFDLDGTAGIPSTTQLYPLLGDFKAADRLEGCIDITGNPRLRVDGQIIRGDDTRPSAEAGTEWDVYARKVGESEVAITGHHNLDLPETNGVLLGQAGHGSIDIMLRTKNAGQVSWQDPTIRVTAPCWRDLIANGSFDYGALSPGWTETVGTVSIEDGTDSLQRYPVSGYWIQSATAVSRVTTIRQTIDVSGYKPGGLTALVSWYTRQFGDLGGANDDYSYVKIEALDDAGASIDSTTSSHVVGPTTHWRRGEVTHTLTNAARKLRIDVSLHADDGEDDPTPSVGVARVRLQLGQLSDELLANPSFDGSTTSWTNVTNSFVVNSSNPYSSRNGTIGAAQGGAFSSSEIKQEVAIPAGYTYGTALLTLARSTTLDNDTGEVVLQVLNGGGTVIASATTGAEYALTAGVAMLNVWERRRLAVQLPDGAVTLRVRLIAHRTIGSGNSGACFDDLSLRIHKDLDPVAELDFNFRSPSRQNAPKTWQRFHLQFPTLPMPFAVWDGANATPSVQPTYRLDGPAHAWSDAIAHDPAKFTGSFLIEPSTEAVDIDAAFVNSIDAYQIVRAAAVDAVDLQASGTDDNGDEYGAFAIDEPWTVAVLFRTDELTWSTAAGLVGRRNGTGRGWGLRIKSTGEIEAVLQGAGGTTTATGAANVTDRAPRWIVLVNDSGANTLRLYDGGTATASTTSVGSIAAAGVPLRIGRDGPASATGGLQIARVIMWNEALSAGDAAALMQYGADPTGLLTAPVGDQSVWVSGPDDEAGATLQRFAASQVPIGYHPMTGQHGLVVAPSSTNRIPTHDFADSGTWSHETNASLTQGLVDATGLAHGVRVTNSAANKGLLCSGIDMRSPFAFGGSFSVVFYARTMDNVTSRSLVVELYDTTPSLIDSSTVTIANQWQRFQIIFEGWADSTATAKLRFVLGSSAIGAFDLAHPTWAASSSDPSFAIQDSGALLGGLTGVRSGHDLLLQGDFEGELYVEGVCAVATPESDASFLEVDTDSNAEGSRALVTGSAGAPKFELYDDAAVLTSESGSVIDWSQGFVLRGRWNSLELPESVGDQVGLVVTGSSADSETYGASSFTAGAAALNGVFLGGDPNHLPPSAMISRAIVRIREPKLSGS